MPTMQSSPRLTLTFSLLLALLLCPPAPVGSETAPSSNSPFLLKSTRTGKCLAGGRGKLTTIDCYSGSDGRPHPSAHWMLVTNSEGTARSLKAGHQARWCLSITHDFFSANLRFAMSAACFQPQSSTAELVRIDSDSVRIRITTPEGTYCLKDSGHGAPCSDTDRFIPATTRWTVLPITKTNDTPTKKAEGSSKYPSLNSRAQKNPSPRTLKARPVRVEPKRTAPHRAGPRRVSA